MKKFHNSLQNISLEDLIMEKLLEFRFCTHTRDQMHFFWPFELLYIMLQKKNLHQFYSRWSGMYSKNVLVFLIIPILESVERQIEDVRTKKILNQNSRMQGSKI